MISSDCLSSLLDLTGPVGRVLCLTSDGGHCARLLQLEHNCEPPTHPLEGRQIMSEFTGSGSRVWVRRQLPFPGPYVLIITVLHTGSMSLTLALGANRQSGQLFGLISPPYQNQGV